ncbi:hypothetical protein [Sphaerotilus sp.]
MSTLRVSFSRDTAQSMPACAASCARTARIWLALARCSNSSARWL